MEGIFFPQWLKSRFRLGAFVVLLLCLGAWWNGSFSPPNVATPLVGVSQVSIWQEPGTGTAPLLEALNKAKREIAIEMYLFTHQQLAEALVDAERRGVQVRVLLEDKPYGGARTPKEIRGQLVESGVEVRLCPPRFQFCHAKFAVIDDEAWIMTANWTKAAFTKNREILAIITAPEIAKILRQIFEADFRGTVFRPVAGPLVISPETSRTTVRELITGAQKEILIATEVWEDGLVQGWIQEAERRGVDVRLLLPYEKHPPAGFLPRETRMLKKPYLHEKVMIVDGVTALVGSLNMSTNSFDQNREVSLLISAPETVQKLRQWWFKDWQNAK